MKLAASKNDRSKRKATAEHSRLYRQLTPAYDLVFPLIIRKRIHRTIQSLGLKSGQRVLEVGIGTGISLDAYPADVNVVGIDLSAEMLQHARRKADQKGLRNIELLEMNAEELTFDDEQFDVVLAFHVISVVSRPRQMMSEMVRVCRPGGTIVLINHFRSRRPWVASLVDRADGVTRRLGWRTDIACDDITGRLPLDVQRRYKSSPLSLFTIVRATRCPSDSPNATEPLSV